MKYLPAWFPGAKFKRQAAEWKIAVDALFEKPFGIAKNSFVSIVFVCSLDTELITSQVKGNASTCLVSTFLKEALQGDEGDKLENVVKNVAGISYAGMSCRELLGAASDLICSRF